MNRSVRLLIILLGVALLAAIVALVFILGNSGNPLHKGFTFIEWAPIIIIPVVMFLTILFINPLFRLFFPSSIKNGVTADAEVLEVQDTGITFNGNPQLKLVLQVRPSLGVAFQAVVRTVVSQEEVGQYRTGCLAVVEYDPARPKRIVIRSIEPALAEPISTEECLVALDRLKDAGLITPEEYQVKREEVIKKI